MAHGGPGYTEHGEACRALCGAVSALTTPCAFCDGTGWGSVLRDPEEDSWLEWMVSALPLHGYTLHLGRKHLWPGSAVRA